MTSRWLLPAGALTAAAEQAGVGLPDGLAAPLDDAARPLAQRLLVELGGADDDGLAPALAAGLGALRTPVATVALTVRAVEGASAPGRSWQAWYVLGQTDLLVLLRRGDDGRVEVAAGPPGELPAELVRILPALPPTGAAVRAVPAAVVPLAALSQIPRDGADLVALAEATGTPSVQLVAAARIAEQAQQSLQVLVTGHARPAGTPVGTLLWYRLHGGWLSVVPEPDGTDRRPVRIAPVDPTDLPGELAPLLAGAIG